MLTDRELIERIKDALGTAEDGEDLIAVARAAHRAEQANAAVERQQKQKFRFRVDRTVSHREYTYVEVESYDENQAAADAMDLLIEADRQWIPYEDSEEQEVEFPELEQNP